jgi:hypothetical protein
MQAKMNEKMNDPKMKQAMAAMQGMGSSMASSTEVKKTGVSRKVAGFACEEWAITMSAMMTMTECVTNDIKYPVQSWAALMEFNESMRKSMSGFGPPPKTGEDLAEKMKSIHGFPVATSTVIDAGITKITNTSEVTEVRHTPIPDSTWQVPAGFTKVDNPMMKALQDPRPLADAPARPAHVPPTLPGASSRPTASGCSNRQCPARVAGRSRDRECPRVSVRAPLRHCAPAAPRSPWHA